MDNNMGLSLPRHDSPIVVVLKLLLYAVLMAATLAWLFWRIYQSRERLYVQLAAYVAKRGWKPGLAIPDSATAVLIATRFRVDASWSDYTFIHTYCANAATLYLGVASSGEDRTSRAGTVIVATADLRAPLECLIATDAQAPEAFVSGLHIMRVRPGAGKGPDLYAHFHDAPSVQDLRFVRTIRIIGLVFGGAESVFGAASVAVLGPSGMVVRGPQLSVNRKGVMSVEPLVQGAEHLLDRCEAVWTENRD
jgi:hypothetical protein